jgi:uncharacterized protein
VPDGWKKIKVALKNNDTECYLNVPFLTSEGTLEAPLTAEDAREALRNSGVLEGIHEDRLIKLFEEARFDQEVLVAEGRPPKDGEDAWVEFFFDAKREFQPKEDSDGRIDYHDVSFFASVAKGDKLCLLHPPTQGETGSSVTGMEIAPKSGRDRLLPQGSNTEVSPHDPNLLLASENGCVTLNKTKFVEVTPRLQIKGDVDFSTGNVNFVGSLLIVGDIKAGFKVTATGDLEVGGCIEDSEVEVGGSMLLKKGFIGRGKGLVKTAGDLTVKYVHGQNIVCGGNLIVGGELMHCKARVAGNVIASSRKGAIIGGKIECQGNIESTQVGNQSYTHTELVLGCDFQLQDRLREIDEELGKLTENQDKVKKALYNFSMLKIKMKGQLSPEHQALYERLQETGRYYPKYRLELDQERKRIGAEIARHKDSFIKVQKTLFPGVKVTIGNYTRIFNEKWDNQVLREVKGEIVGTA